MPRLKPSAPRFNAGSPLAAGCRLFALLSEGTGTPRDLVTRQFATVTGAVAWSFGAWGAERGNFALTRFDIWTRSVPSTWPMAQAVLFTNTNTGQQVPFGLGSTGSAAVDPLLNNGAAGNIRYIYITDGGTTNIVAAATGQPINDGSPRLIHLWSPAANDHRIYLDGVLVASGTTDLSANTYTLARVGIGARSAASISQAAFGCKVIAAAHWSAACPDPATLAADWLSGAFTMARPRRVPLAFPAAAPATSAVPAALHHYRLRRA